MEKRADFGITSAILLALAAAPTLTYGLNKVVGHDPSKKIKKAIGEQPEIAESVPDPLLQSARGLHAHRAGT